MKTSRLVKGYLIFELAAIVAFGFLLTPVSGTAVFFLGPRVGLLAAALALPLNPIIGIIGIFIAGSEIRKGIKTPLVITLLVLSILMATLFPAAAAERGLSHLFGMLIAG